MLAPLKVKPGVNTQFTPTLAELQWVISQLIRFRDGLLQKVGGWVSVLLSPFQGVCRGLHSWETLAGILTLGIGTNLKLLIFQGGALFDLTPVRVSGSLGLNPFTTANGSNVVTVLSPNHGLSVNDFAELSGATTFNNVTMNGEFQVQSIIDQSNYTLQASTTANAAGSGGGSGVSFEYLLPVGSVDSGQSASTGYSVGGYGVGGYGGGSGVASLCRLWFIDNWGEFMLACPQNGALYEWQPANGTNTRATVLPNSPLFNSSMLVGSAQQQVISLGAESGGAQDPMLVRFSDVGDNTDWTATVTNQAGSFRLSRGSEIVGALGSALTILIWTNEGLWLMQYIGPPLVYSFVQVGFGCGLYSPKAAVSTPVGIFWMESNNNFFMFNGTVQPLPCSVRDQIYQNINTAQSNKVFAAINSAWNEVWWFYPSLNSTEIDSYVKYNYVENLWDYGKLARTAWRDHENFPFPMATDPSSNLYEHENGVDAAGMPMDSYAQTGFVMDKDGDNLIFCERVVPDFNTFVGQAQISAVTVDYPNSDSASPLVFGPVTVVAGITPYAILRARNRGVAVKVESNVLGGNFRMGLNRLKMIFAGKR